MEQRGVPESMGADFQIAKRFVASRWRSMMVAVSLMVVLTVAGGVWAKQSQEGPQANPHNEMRDVQPAPSAEVHSPYAVGDGWRVVNLEAGKIYVLIDARHADDKALFEQMIDTLCEHQDSCSLIFGFEHFTAPLRKMRKPS